MADEKSYDNNFINPEVLYNSGGIYKFGDDI